MENLEQKLEEIVESAEKVAEACGAVEQVFSSPPSNKHLIERMKSQYEAMAKEMPHREYGLALTGAVKALEAVEHALKVVANVEADLKKQAESAEAARKASEEPVQG